MPSARSAWGRMLKAFKFLESEPGDGCVQAAEELVRRHRVSSDPSTPADSDFLQVDQSMKTVTIKDTGLLAAARFLQGAFLPDL